MQENSVVAVLMLTSPEVNQHAQRDRKPTSVRENTTPAIVEPE
jgi:hypothetical protein